jgi:hypothetical protein
MLSKNEMEGYISNIDKIQHLDPNNYPRAVVEHFFTCVLHRDMPTEFGLKLANELYKFLQKHSDLKDNLESWSKAIKLTSFRVLIESFFSNKLTLPTDRLSRIKSAQNLCQFIQLAIECGEKYKT